MKKAGKIFEWEKRRAECQNQQGNLRRGVGVACFSYTSNTWPVGVEIAGARLLMNRMGTINVQSGATEIGQVPTPSSRKWWQKPWGFRSATFALFQHKIPMLRRSIRRICLTPELCCRACMRSAALLLKEKIIAHAAVMPHQSAMNLLIKGHIVLIERPEEPLMSLKDLAMDASPP